MHEHEQGLTSRYCNKLGRLRAYRRPHGHNKQLAHRSQAGWIPKVANMPEDFVGSFLEAVSLLHLGRSPFGFQSLVHQSIDGFEDDRLLWFKSLLEWSPPLLRITFEATTWSHQSWKKVCGLTDWWQSAAAHSLNSAWPSLYTDWLL